MPRPDPLPPSARGVVERSRILPAGVKLVWTKTHLLDDPTDGAWISAARLADELGMEPATVERYRHFLVRAGLLVRGPRAGRRGATWYATLPPGTVPPGRGASPQQVAQCGRVLDEHLARLKRRARPKSDHDPTQGALGFPDDDPGRQDEKTRMMIRDVARAMGGTGGVRFQPPSTVSASVSRSPDGEEKPMVPRAPTAETEKVPPPTSAKETELMHRTMRAWDSKRVVR